MSSVKTDAGGKHMSKRIIRFACVLALFGMLGACVGVTYARYKSTVSETLVFEAKLIDETGTVVITSAEGWQKTSSGAKLSFTLSGKNVSDPARFAYLRLTATEAFPSTAEVTLSVGGVSYGGKPSPVKSGELLHAQMGSGTEYRFTDPSGNDRIWQLTASTKMTLTVSGASDTSLLRLIAKEK